MKKVICVTVAVLIVSLFCVESRAVSTSAQSAILIEAQSGDVIYEKDADTRRGPASTTKIMTAFIAIEKRPLDAVVEVAAEAAGVEGSSAYLYAGEKITVESLLYALMLQSANDAAAAIAYEIAGGIEEFAEIMNEKAAALGMSNTHFSNPHGLDDDDHYTTARDLATLARAAMENETFEKIVRTVKKAVPMQSGEATRVFINHNRLLRMYDDIVGVKTGFTKRCGRTLVSASKKDGVTLIAVTLSDGDDWRDHRAMHDYGQEKYESVKLIGHDEIFESSAQNGETVYYSSYDDVYATLPRERGEIRAEAEYPANGTGEGKIRFYIKDKPIAETPLLPASKDER